MAAMNITTEKFNELMNGDRPVLVDYWAPWCSYCRRITTAYDKVAEQYGCRVSFLSDGQYSIENNDSFQSGCAFVAGRKGIE